MERKAKQLGIHSFKAPISEGEQKRIQRRVEIAEHQQHYVNFERKFVPVMAVEIRSDAENRIRYPADEEGHHKHCSRFGRFEVFQIPLIIYIGKLFRRETTCVGELVMLASNQIYQDVKYARD